MAHTIKVRRSGIERIFRKTPFRAWLDEQPKSGLTYTDEFKKSASKGWTTEDFCRESWKRGLDVRIGTMFKWTSGSKPRPFIVQALRMEFPTITF